MRLTDRNEYTNASNRDHPFTSPVAFRRKTGGAASVPAAMAPLLSARDQLVVLDPASLLVQLDDRRLQHPLLVRAARVDGQRLPHPLGSLALVDVPVEG